MKFHVEWRHNHVWGPIFGSSYEHIYKNIHLCKGKGREAREAKGRERKEGKGREGRESYYLYLAQGGPNHVAQGGPNHCICWGILLA